MAEPGYYPPPVFDCPSQNPIIKPQTFQHQHGQSGFHPSMWNWNETPSSPPWPPAHSSPGDWRTGPPTGHGHHGGSHGPPAGYGHHDGSHGWPPGRGHHGPNQPYHGQNFNRGGRGHHQGGHRGGRQNYGPPNNNNNNNGKKRNKKEPEFSHFCDTCDRGFKTQEKHEEHMSQHVKCSVADCNFTAHEKIVSFHWKNNHGPGAKRIKLDTADEIARWRAERRKNYPTLQNLEKKRNVMAAREARGDVLETAQFGRMRGRGRGRGRGNRRFQGGAPPGPQGPGSCAPERPPPLTQPPRNGDPLGALADSDPGDSDREEAPGGLVVAPKHMSSGLGALVASYGSMTESESDEEPVAMPIQRASELVQENQALLRTLPPRPQGGVPHQSPHLATDPHNTPGRGRGRGRGGGGRRGRGGRGGWHNTESAQKRRATLLEMLLAPDIRHERNVLLQCVRYIVRNDFFGLEDKPQGVGAKAMPVTTGGAPRTSQEATQEEVMDSATRPSVGKDSTGGAAVPSQGGTREEPRVVQRWASGAKAAAAAGDDVQLDSRPSGAVVGGNATGAVVDQNVPKTFENECDQSGPERPQGTATADDGTPRASERGLVPTVEEEEAATPKPNDLDEASLAPRIYDDEIWEIPGDDM